MTDNFKMSNKLTIQTGCLVGMYLLDCCEKDLNESILKENP